MAETAIPPTYRQRFVFWFKSSLLSAFRWWLNALLVHDKRHPVHPSPFEPAGPFREVRSPLWAPDTHAELVLQAGKVHNLRRAARDLDGLDLAPGQRFSFWAQLGKPVRRRGYVLGRELRHGCLIPTIGGGLCQLSNALHELCLQTGTAVAERHGHTQAVPGSYFVAGRDATIFWRHVDLCFVPDRPLKMRCWLTDKELVLRFYLPAETAAGEAAHG